MAISAKDVMELRKQTDCGMMECKKALTQADGDFEMPKCRSKNYLTCPKLPDAWLQIQNGPNSLTAMSRFSKAG